MSLASRLGFIRMIRVKIIPGSAMLRTSSRTLKIGDTAPDFELPDADRRIVRLSDYRGRPVVLVFIRGTW